MSCTNILDRIYDGKNLETLFLISPKIFKDIAYHSQFSFTINYGHFGGGWRGGLERLQHCLTCKVNIVFIQTTCRKCHHFSNSSIILLN